MRPEGECIYNPYTPKRRDVTDIYADWAFICIYQNCSCPDHSSCCERADSRAPSKKASLSLNHGPKGEERCVSYNGNKENGSSSLLRRT